MQDFVWPVRVYYEDTDAGGVVYHANYLHFMERARTEYLRQFGFEQTDLIEQFGLVFAVRSMQIDFLKPARFNDLLQVKVEVKRLQRVSMTFLQTVLSSDAEQVYCRAEVKVASIAQQTFRPMPIPETLLEAFRQ